MRALVLGGTAFIGPHVVSALKESGFEILTFNRGRRKPCKGDPGFIEGDRRRLLDYAAALRAARPDVVVDMIAFTESDAMAAVEVFGGHAAGMVVASSVDVYAAYGRLNRLETGNPDPEPLREDSPLRRSLFPFRGPAPRAAGDPARWVDDYDKILVEKVFHGQDRIPVRVLRFPMVYGPGDYQHRMFEYLKRMDDGRPAVVLGASEAAWRSTRGYVEDVASAVALAARAPGFAHAVYNAGEREALGLGDWVAAVGKAAGWQGRVVTAPDELMPEARRTEDWRHDLVSDTSRIRAELGFAERTPPDEALLRTVRWERANPPRSINPASFDYAAEDALLKNAE